MSEIKIYPLIGICIGFEYLDAFQEDTMKSVDVYLGIIGISFRWI